MIYKLYGLLFIYSHITQNEEASDSLNISYSSYKSPKHKWWIKDLKLEISDQVSITAGRELSLMLP